MNFHSAVASGQFMSAFAPLVQRCRRVFPGTEQQLGLLRRWLMSLMPDHPVLDDVMIVATELASNAIKHTASGHGGRFAVEVTSHPGVVRIAVADCGAQSEPTVIDDPLAETGRGLAMVAELAIRSGVLGGRWGRIVWADVACEDRLSIMPMAPGNVLGPSLRDGAIALARFRGEMPWLVA
jgi:anti-sigma regulatory factor (Ser/Thr protein kinase)